jgi:hypothetical protein
MSAGAGAAPDIFYAQGMPTDPPPDMDTFNMKDCSIILAEAVVCKDLGCHDKYT